MRKILYSVHYPHTVHCNLFLQMLMSRRFSQFTAKNFQMTRSSQNSTTWRITLLPSSGSGGLGWVFLVNMVARVFIIYSIASFLSMGICLSQQLGSCMLSPCHNLPSTSIGTCTSHKSKEIRSVLDCFFSRKKKNTHLVSHFLDTW